MFELALKARLPLISVYTRDKVNHREIITRFVPEGRKIGFFTQDAVVKVLKGAGGASKEVTQAIEQCDYLVISRPKDDQILDLYESAAALGKTIILINFEGDTNLTFDCGDLPTPQSLVVELLQEITIEGNQEELHASLRGLTLKEIGEVIRLTTARDGALTARTIKATRRTLAPPLQGLTPVDTETEFYYPQEQLELWLAAENYFFIEHPDIRLCPRGLLFDGPPGTGKTEGTRHLAHSLGVPLYRLDIGMTMNKYVGESELNLSHALGHLIREAPCVLLLDEVEKIFSEDTDHGVTTRMLAHLLWFLQSHRERILTVMTTNDIKVIPPELYREGRIDEVLKFEPLNTIDAMAMFLAYLDEFDVHPTPEQVKENVDWYGVSGKTQASCMQDAKRYVKSQLRGDSDAN